MCDEVKAFFKKMKYGAVMLSVNFFAALVAVLALKAIVAVFTGE